MVFLPYTALEIILTTSLIIYIGSKRSLNGFNYNLNLINNENNENENNDENIEILTKRNVLLFPIIGSISLLTLYYFFKQIQYFLIIYFIISSFISILYVLLPFINKIYLKFLLKFYQNYENIQNNRNFILKKLPYFITITLTIGIIIAWIFTSHWLYVDIIGICLCITIMCSLKLPNLKIAFIALSLLFLYDIFWVFFSSNIFGKSVMVEVAKKKSSNPAQNVGEKLNIQTLKSASPELELPIKLIFPIIDLLFFSSYTVGNTYSNNNNNNNNNNNTVRLRSEYTMLGLGDIVLPGLLIALALRFDNFLKKYNRNLINNYDEEIGGEIINIIPVINNNDNNNINYFLNKIYKLSYFHISLIGYISGLFITMWICWVWKSAQPALLYLVPFTLLPLIIISWKKNELNYFWNGFDYDENNQNLINNHNNLIINDDRLIGQELPLLSTNDDYLIDDYNNNNNNNDNNNSMKKIYHMDSDHEDEIVIV